jgi:hypothetical protein
MQQLETVINKQDTKKEDVHHFDTDNKLRNRDGRRKTKQIKRYSF